MTNKKIRFALKMKNDVEVRTLQELKETFDLNQIVSYYLDGKLEVWLLDRYYEDLADQIQKLDRSDPGLRRRLCEIFDVEYPEDAMSIEEIEAKKQRIKKLREITDDEEIIKSVDFVAFSQDELADLLDEEARMIYLCGSDFHIPMSKKGITYIGIETKLNITSKEIEKYQLNDIMLINLLDENIEDETEEEAEYEVEDETIVNTVAKEETSGDIKTEVLLEVQAILEKIIEKKFYVIVKPRYLNLEVNRSEMVEYNNKNYRSESMARKIGEHRLKKAYDIVTNCFDTNTDTSYATQISDKFFDQIREQVIKISTMLSGLDKETKVKNKFTLRQLNEELQLDQLRTRIERIAEAELNQYYYKLGNFSVYAKDIISHIALDIDKSSQAVLSSDHYYFDATRPYERLRDKLLECSEDYPQKVIVRCKKDIIGFIHRLVLDIE